MPVGEIPPEGTIDYFEYLAKNDPSVSDAQRDRLSRAASTGNLSFEEYSQAIDAALGCITDAGVAIYGPKRKDNSGYPRLSYGFAAGTGEDGSASTPVPDACIRQHSWYVEMAYSDQPRVQQLLSDSLESKRESVRICAEGAGITADNQLPVRAWLLELVHTSAGRDCVAAADITEF